LQVWRRRYCVHRSARVLTNNLEWPRGGEEIWYSLFVSGDQSLRVIEAHSQSLTYRANFSRALAVPLRALDHVPGRALDARSMLKDQRRGFASDDWCPESHSPSISRARL